MSKSSSKSSEEGTRKSSGRGRARTLWIWLGVGCEGNWIPLITNCDEGARRFKPPRNGKEPFEIIWTQLSTRTIENPGCGNGFCEFDDRGMILVDNCHGHVGCNCDETIEVNEEWRGMCPLPNSGIGTITPCNQVKKPERKKKKSKK